MKVEKWPCTCEYTMRQKWKFYENICIRFYISAKPARLVTMTHNCLLLMKLAGLFKQTDNVKLHSSYSLLEHMHMLEHAQNERERVHLNDA